MARVIYAKKELVNLAHDLDMQLKNNVDPKVIFKGITKRISRIKDSKWTRVDWANG